jgi:hypothetical protein
MRAWWIAAILVACIPAAILLDQPEWLGAVAALGLDPVLAVAAIAIGAFLRPWWACCLALATLIVLIEWRVDGYRVELGLPFSMRSLLARIYAAALFASAAWVLRDALSIRSK